MLPFCTAEKDKAAGVRLMVGLGGGGAGEVVGWGAMSWDSPGSSVASRCMPRAGMVLDEEEPDPTAANPVEPVEAVEDGAAEKDVKGTVAVVAVNDEDRVDNELLVVGVV